MKDKQVKHFNKTELESLIRLFHELVGNPVVHGRTVILCSGLDREKFNDLLRNTFEITDDMFIVFILRLVGRSYTLSKAALQQQII